MRTLSDVGRRAIIDPNPRDATVRELGARRRPAPLSQTRTSFERTTWRVVAQITEWRLAADGTIQAILFDDRSYMRAALPPARCIPDHAKLRRAALRTRAALVAACGLPTSSWQPSGAISYVAGVGYWGPLTIRQAAPNGAQLHPVTGLRIVAGCR